MGLFDEISGLVGSALNRSGGSPGEGMQAQMMSVLQEHGIDGVSGLVQQFEQSGLGAHAASWIGDGQNLPISAAQVQAALGNPVVEALGRRFGVDPATAANLLAQHLPDAVDQATPDGLGSDAS